jgi:GntR family transcriptional regulator
MPTARDTTAKSDIAPLDADPDAVAAHFWEMRLSPDMLDEGQPTPLYHQIYMVMRGVIEQNEVGPGTLLPGEQALTLQFAVSRITVKRALNELAADKLVSRHRGRGTIVAPRSSIPMVRSSFDNLIESLQEMGLVTQIELLEVGEVSAGDSAAGSSLKLPANALLHRVVRRRLLEGQPLAYLITFTPKDIAASFSVEDVAHKTFLALLERAGAAPHEAEQWITAVAAEPQMAAALDVSVSAPLLKIERIMRDASGRPVQLSLGYYRPDRFQYHVRNVTLREQRCGALAAE